MPPSPINFAHIAQAALSAARTLLAEWLPGGRIEGGEYKALNPTRSDSKVGSFSVNLSTGKWGDFATGDAGGDLISLFAYLNNLDQGKAAREVVQRLGLEAAANSSPPEKATKPKSEWVPVLPVPDGTPAPSGMAHMHYGAPTAVWAYRDAQGRLLGYIRRFTNSEGGKEILPLTWCRNGEGHYKWHAVAFPTPRPLYGLELLEQFPQRPVLIVEGEKCADVARQLLGERSVVVTWPGGAKAVKKADWTPLAGRLVVIWPDCDAQKDNAGVVKPAGEQPGIKAAEQIAEILLTSEHRAAQVRIVEIPEPGAVSEGWDVADAIAEGFDADRLHAFLRKQRPPLAAGHANEARARIKEADSTWRDRLVRSNNGFTLKDCRENVIYLLRDHPEWQGVLGADTFAKRIVVRRASPLGHAIGAEWSANDDIALGIWLQERERLLVRSPDTIAAGVRFAAKLAPFHPVCEWLETLTWDGQSRVDQWTVQFLGAADSPYHRKIGRYFLINMIRRIYEPGCVMRSVPVLEGGQDKGKSRSLFLLAQPWFSDTTFRVGDKDSFQQIQGIWVYEISELESFTRVEATAVKAFVSSTVDNFRAPYERQNERHPRQTVFAATTNASEYLKDWTGGTRFWPLACGDRIDLDGIAAVREQLLAEAILLYRRGERAFPTAEEQVELFTPEQDRRMMAHPWLEVIVDFLNPSGGRRDDITVGEILIDAIKLKPERMNPQGAEAQRVGQILHSLGWTKVRGGTPAKRIWKWQRPPTVVVEEDHGDIPF